MTTLSSTLGRTSPRFAALLVTALLLLQPELASAQQVLRAGDGQSLDGQSQPTRQTFEAMYGSTCAPQEWVWQHSLAIDPSMVDGPAASDGQKLSGQDDDVQLVFVAVWGPAAASEWLAEHNAIVAHHVLPAPVAPIPCPAVRPISAVAINSGHLEDAVAAAKNGNLPDAHGSLNQFRDLWNTTRDDIRKRSPVVADAIQAAYDQAAAVISDPRRPTPQQSEYLPVLQDLLKVVQNADNLLGGAAPR
jgi:hypothetical protein